MEERNQIQHLILNELHDDAIDRLYLKVMTENTYGGYLLAVVYPNDLSISLDIIKNFTRSYPSNYNWKSLQEDPNNEQYITIVKKEFYRVGKLNVILRQLNQYNYYLTLSYLTNMISEDKKIKNIETNLEQHQDIIIKNYIEINDEITRSGFKAAVEPYLRGVQGRRGIYDFLVVCDSSNNTSDVIDRNEFNAEIYIKPARSINFITITFVATRTGVSFNELIN